MVNFRNIPTSSQWITFPVSPQEKITVNWEDNFHAYVNTYYVAKCYYGVLGDLKLSSDDVVTSKLEVPGPIFYKGTTKLTVLGETKIYIAAEFIEEEYAGSPSDLGQFHLKDISRLPSDGKKDPSWITMKLNGAFCYGQNGSLDRLRRYIVYHPSVGPGIRRPNIHQHRFTDTEISNAIREGLEGASGDMPEKYKFLGAALNSLVKVLHKKSKAAIGDSLWVFLDEKHLSATVPSSSELQFPNDESALRNLLKKIQELEFSKTGTEAKKSQPQNILPTPSNQAPFVPPVVPEQKEEQKPGSEQNDVKNPEQKFETREEMEMDEFDKLLKQTYEIFEEFKHLNYSDISGEKLPGNHDNSTRNAILGGSNSKQSIVDGNLAQDSTNPPKQNDTSLLAVLNQVHQAPAHSTENKLTPQRPAAGTHQTTTPRSKNLQAIGGKQAGAR